MSDPTGVGTVRAGFVADTQKFDADVQGVGQNLRAVGAAAEAAAAQVAQAGDKIDRSAQLQARAAEAARRAWERESFQKMQASIVEDELSRKKEMAALRADIEARSLAAAASKAADAALESAMKQAYAAQVGSMARTRLAQEAAAAEKAHADAIGLSAERMASMGSIQPGFISRLGAEARETEMAGAAQKAFNAATESGIPPMSASSAALRTLEGNFQHNIRAAERFISTTLGLGPLLEAAFPVVGAIALVGALAKMGYEAWQAYENFVHLKGAIEAIKDAEIDVANADKQMTDEIERNIENILSKTAGEPTALRQRFQFQSGQGIDLESYFYSEKFKKQADDLKTNYETLYKNIAPQDIPDRLAKIRKEVSALQNAVDTPDLFGMEVTSVNGFGPRAGRDPQDYFKHRLMIAQQIQSELEQATNLRASGLDSLQADIKAADEQFAKKGAAGAHDEAQELLHTYQTEFARLQSINPMSEGQIASFWSRLLPQFDQDSPEYREILDRVAAAAQKIHERLHEALKKAAETPAASTRGMGPAGFSMSSGGTLGIFSSGQKTLRDAATKLAETQASVNAQWQIALDKVNLLRGQITPLAAAYDMASAHAEEYRAQLKELRDQLAEMEQGDALARSMGDQTHFAQKLQLQTQVTELENRKRIAALEDQQAVLSQTWTGMIDSVWDELARKANDTTNQIRQTALQFVDSMNSEIARAATGGRANFGAIFRTAGEGLMKTGLEKLEGALVGSLGLGTGKADGSQGNPLHVLVDNAGGGGAIPDAIAALFGGTSANVTGPGGTANLSRPGAGGTAMQSLAKSSAHGILGWLNDSDFFSKLGGGKLFGAGGVFSNMKGFSGGGPIPANMPSIVGEKGPEIFTPPSSGTIIPNHMLGGGGNAPLIGYIDARGTDPALTRANFEQALRVTYASAVARAEHSVMDRARRRPR